MSEYRTRSLHAIGSRYKLDRDPEKARKRAKSDLRCAARKLGLGEACAALRELLQEERNKGKGGNIRLSRAEQHLAGASFDLQQEGV